MHPLRADLDALFARPGPRTGHLLDRLDVRARPRHALSVSWPHERGCVAGSAVRSVEGHVCDTPHVDAGCGEGRARAVSPCEPLLGHRDADHRAWHIDADAAARPAHVLNRV